MHCTAVQSGWTGWRSAWSRFCSAGWRLRIQSALFRWSTPELLACRSHQCQTGEGGPPMFFQIINQTLSRKAILSLWFGNMVSCSLLLKKATCWHLEYNNWKVWKHFYIIYWTIISQRKFFQPKKKFWHVLWFWYFIHINIAHGVLHSNGFKQSDWALKQPIKSFWLLKFCDRLKHTWRYHRRY